jgi:exopolyphosphatase/guanosine-5'-triphosphate,3'-diphosphate pyrophosphatase
VRNGTYLAAVDLGSNSFRCEIGRLESGQIVRADYLKETVRLGGGLDEKERLTEAAALRGLACLERFAERIRDFHPQYVRAVATQTLREAVNREDFLRRATDVLGFSIEVISGREEARLIYSGVSHLLPASNERRLVIDIGGRSTELILGRNLTAGAAESHRVGSVSLSQRYFADGRFTARAFSQAIIAAQAAFEESQDIFAPEHWDVAYGSSGTVGAVADLLSVNTVTDGDITLEGLQWCSEFLISAGSVDKLRMEGLKEDRKAVIGGGLSVLLALFKTFEITSLTSAKGALRQGVLFDLLGRKGVVGDGDLRHNTVRRLQESFKVDVAQAERVEHCARKLYQMIVPDADTEQINELDWASRLHELGMAVSHSEFHRHGAYIVEKADAAGFSQSQQQRLAALILGQRGGLRKIEVMMLDRSFVMQLIALRLATLLCHARRPPQLRCLVLQRDGDEIDVEVDEDWAATHSQSMHLLQEEVENWRRMPVRLMLRDARQFA